ncbi:MAG: restriction endonuclease [Elusimicrobiota bacterium]|nr:restriction endonuclease [Elusimicrobiota bacterium]
MRTTDNNYGQSLSEILDKNEEYEYADLEAIANKTISKLCEENPNLLIFPQTLGGHNDEIGKSAIFEFREDKIFTENIMGFVGRNKMQITIHSRFYEKDNDYFLHYLLSKVFSINIFKFEQRQDKESIWDFLLYLFPHYLKKALSLGLYKEYRSNKYNDSNFRGAIDINRHIKLNTPFAGKIAYTMREYNFDNKINQLIRHTLEYIKTHKFGRGVLNSNNGVAADVDKIIFHTPSYNKKDLQKTIKANLKPISHPYFAEYKMLQQICLQILRKDKISFGVDKNQIYGLLFDGAWLWEEYLNKIFIEHNLGFTHAENKTDKNPLYLFEGKKHSQYPDFYKKSNFIADAKYKGLENRAYNDDLHQIISYMYIEKAHLGGFIYPISANSHNSEISEKVGILNGYGGVVKKWGLKIAQNAPSFAAFKDKMKENENNFVSELRKHQT